MKKVIQVRYKTRIFLRQLWPIKLTFHKTKAKIKIVKERLASCFLFVAPTLLKIGLPWDLCVAAGGTVTRTRD